MKTKMIIHNFNQEKRAQALKHLQNYTCKQYIDNGNYINVCSHVTTMIILNVVIQINKIYVYPNFLLLFLLKYN